MMKDGVRIINCARAGSSTSRTSSRPSRAEGRGRGLRRLREGAAGAAPAARPRELHRDPHLGASTKEAQENVATAVAEQIVDYLVAGTVRNAVNVPSVPADQLPMLSPYINLAERMGSSRRSCSTAA